MKKLPIAFLVAAIFSAGAHSAPADATKPASSFEEGNPFAPRRGGAAPTSSMPLPPVPNAKIPGGSLKGGDVGKSGGANTHSAANGALGQQQTPVQKLQAMRVTTIVDDTAILRQIVIPMAAGMNGMAGRMGAQGAAGAGMGMAGAAMPTMQTGGIGARGGAGGANPQMAGMVSAPVVSASFTVTHHQETSLFDDVWVWPVISGKVVRLYQIEDAESFDPKTVQVKKMKLLFLGSMDSANGNAVQIKQESEKNNAGAFTSNSSGGGSSYGGASDSPVASGLTAPTGTKQ